MFIKLIETESFNFDSVAASSSMILRRVRGVDVSRFSKYTLVVRLEDGTLGTNCTITFDAYPAWPLPADPSRDYETASTGGTVTLSSTSVIGRIQTATVTAQTGPALDLVMTGSKPAGGGNCNAIVSVGLLAYE